MPKTKSQIKTASAAEDSSFLLNEDANAARISSSLSPTLGYCKICLNKFTDDEQTSSFVINYCKCRFCLSCLNQYIRQCVENFNVLPIYCPDPKCRLNGFLEPDEIKAILLKHSSTQAVDTTSDSNNNHTQKDETEQFEDETNLSYYKKYLKVSENIEIIRDPNRTYCPVATCENVCQIERAPKDAAAGSSSSSFELQPVKVTCNKCQVEFCSNCLQIEVEPMKSPCKCKKKTKQESSDGTKESAQRVSITTSLLFNFENIKQCPKCGTLFERADGCAQIMCKCCKHTFCFYCLKSLENDFLLKHYTKNGPCQGKLGHSRISLFFHRIRVMAVFSGTILLVVLLSPFVLLLLPCFLLSNRFRGVCYKFLEKYT